MRNWGPKLDIAPGNRRLSSRPARAAVPQFGNKPSAGTGKRGAAKSGPGKGGQRINTALGEVIIEFVQVGNAVKVSAMDTESLTEVSIMGPLSATETELKRTVIAKLEYRLKGKRR